MTWTLRLHDDNGVEIGWITPDPYEHAITHPDGEEAWDEVKFKFRNSQHPVQGGGPEFLESGQEIYTQRFDTLNISGDGKKHGEWLEDECLAIDGVESAVLADE
jgi:hypothetical protein